MSNTENTARRITIRRPDDWHLHLRDGRMLEAVVPYTARQFARAIIMPNLKPPVTTVVQAEGYRNAIQAALPPGMDFTPLMTAYLTERIDAEELARGYARGVFTAAKLYPEGATTNSADGVSDIRNIRPVLEKMQAIGMPLLIHGEVTDHSVDVFDREAVFIERTLGPLANDFPELKIVLEHITTKQGVEFVEGARTGIGGTITAHHLHINRTDLFRGGIRPHLYCLPIAKREEHRLALRRAATSGNTRFFLGTDSAPHEIGAKESACGCAGVFTAHAAIELYAEVFDEEGALDKLEGFASMHGPNFYGLPLNKDTVTLEKRAEAVPDLIHIPGAREAVMPFRSGETVAWRMVDAPAIATMRSAETTA